METIGGSNPFVVFTFIAAPAVMTNAAAVMSLTTANRLARAVDRGRTLVADLSRSEGQDSEMRRFQVREVGVAHQRAELLIRALGAFQLAFGSFAAASLVALCGACLALIAPKVVVTVTLFLVMAVMLVAIGALTLGAGLLVHESRLAYTILHEQTVRVAGGFHRSLPPGL
jgi:hypothetical protein